MALPFSFSDSYSDKPILATNKPYYSPGLHQFVNINFFPAEVHQDYFPKTLYFKCLTERKDINYQKMFLLIFHSATTSILT